MNIKITDPNKPQALQTYLAHLLAEALYIKLELAQAEAMHPPNSNQLF